MKKQLFFIVMSSCYALCADQHIDMRNLDPALRQRIIDLLQNQQPPAEQQTQTRSPRSYTQEQPQQSPSNSQQNNNSDEVDLFCNIASNLLRAAITQDQSKLTDIGPDVLKFVAKKVQNNKRLRTGDDEEEMVVAEHHDSADSEALPN
jgi:hypothetical protein